MKIFKIQRDYQKLYRDGEFITPLFIYGLSCGSAGKESTCNEGDLGLIPALGRSLGVWKGYPLQYSGLENSKDCIVHGDANSQTQLSDFHTIYIQGNRGSER